MPETPADSSFMGARAMTDPDFSAPIQKFSEPPEGEGPSGPPPCGLGIVSLVFGILGMTVLPLVGSIIAIVTGHLALGEIRESGGRLGGRASSKAGLILGYLWFALALLVVSIGLTLVMPSRTGVDRPAPPAPIADARSGVMMANELDAARIAELKNYGLKDDDEIICVYINPGTSYGTETAILTDRRLTYVKGSRSTTFDLKDVETVLDDAAYHQQYGPANAYPPTYSIEVKRKSGGRMRIVIQGPGGPHFYHALLDAYKAAGTKPD
jgi:hypothetical protein